MIFEPIKKLFMHLYGAEAEAKPKLEVRIFEPENFTKLVQEKLLEMSNAEISRRGGFDTSALCRWSRGDGCDLRMAIQDKLHRFFGDDLMTHGLDFEKFRALINQKSAEKGSREAEAADLGVEYAAFYTWIDGSTKPRMGRHRMIYDAYGLDVFKRMGHKPEEKKETWRVPRRPKKKIKLFNPDNLADVMQQKLENTTQADMCRRAGLASVMVSRWSTGQKNNLCTKNQEKLHLICGDDLFTHGLDLKKFRDRLQGDIIRFRSIHWASQQLELSYTGYKLWADGECIPTMRQHERIYKVYGLSVFKRMYTKRTGK